MRRSAWAAASLVLLLGACVPDVDISRDRTLSGHLKAKTFRVRRGAVVTVDDDLFIESQGPAAIEGDMHGELGSGAVIEIRVSSGDLVVDASVEAGSGADGEEPGEDGAAGGSVRLRADRGEIRLRGALTAGAGGEGAGRRVQGRGDIRVASGAGGAGGDVEILGAAVELGAGASGGDGGAGGGAFAEVVELAPGAPGIVDRGESSEDEEEDGVDDEPLPIAGSAQAVSRSGGNGGSVRVQAGRAESPAAAPVALRGGAGGETSRAAARGGSAASASLEKPGAGGDVSLRWSGLTAPATGWELVPGIGGDAGRLGAISGTAVARVAAGVRTNGGGDAGKAFLGAALAGTGAGGDSANVLAKSALDAKYDFGGPGSAGVPGKPAAAQAP